MRIDWSLSGGEIDLGSQSLSLSCSLRVDYKYNFNRNNVYGFSQLLKKLFFSVRITNTWSWIFFGIMSIVVDPVMI